MGSASQALCIGGRRIGLAGHASIASLTSTLGISTSHGVVSFPPSSSGLAEFVLTIGSTPAQVSSTRIPPNLRTHLCFLERLPER